MHVSQVHNNRRKKKKGKSKYLGRSTQENQFNLKLFFQLVSSFCLDSKRDSQRIVKPSIERDTSRKKGIKLDRLTRNSIIPKKKMSLFFHYVILDIVRKKRDIFFFWNRTSDTFYYSLESHKGKRTLDCFQQNVRDRDRLDRGYVSLFVRIFISRRYKGKTRKVFIILQ